VNLPLMEHGRFVALFFMLSTEARIWTPEEIGFLRNVADRTRGRLPSTSRTVSTSLAPRVVCTAIAWTIASRFFMRWLIVALFFMLSTEARIWTPEEIGFLRNVADRTRAAIVHQRQVHERSGLECDEGCPGTGGSGVRHHVVHHHGDPIPEAHSLRDYGSYIEALKRGETVVVDDVMTDARTAGSGASLLDVGPVVP
jgi:hypothetical protein